LQSKHIGPKEATEYELVIYIVFSGVAGMNLAQTRWDFVWKTTGVLLIFIVLFGKVILTTLEHCQNSCGL